MHKIIRIAAMALCAAPSMVWAQSQELGLTIGAIATGDRSLASPIGAVKISTSTGFALQANYGYRLFDAKLAAVYAELNLLANGKRDLSASLSSLTHDYATLYLTPGVRLKLFPHARLSPYGAVGGGYAWYQQSKTTLAANSNPAPRNLNRAVFDYGAGVDAALIPFIGLRFEVRDFFSGKPALNAIVNGTGQHNLVVSGGVVLRFGH